MTRLALLVTLVGSTLAFAQDAEARPKGHEIKVGVDESFSVDVGYAHGVACDSPDIVQATIQTADADGGDVNQVTFTGVAVGTTQCVAGNAALGGPQVLFTVTVKKNKQHL